LNPTPALGDDSVQVTAAAGETVTVCAYNSSTASGTLRIVKMGGAVGQTFTIDIDRAMTGVDVATLDVAVTGPDQDDRDATIPLPPGNCTLRELPHGTYGFWGWAGPQPGTDICGGNPI